MESAEARSARGIAPILAQYLKTVPRRQPESTDNAATRRASAGPASKVATEKKSKRVRKKACCSPGPNISITRALGAQAKDCPDS